MEIANGICPGYEIREELRETINDLFRWCMMLDGKLDTNKGLWLYGNIGTGKSTMLRIIKEFCKEVRPKSDGKIYSFAIISANEICRKYAKKGDDGISEYIKSRRLAIDEIGTETIPTAHYSNAINVIEQVLLARYDNRFDSFTHVTTNLTEDERKSRYKLRVYDRCKEMFNFVEFKGKTFRH